MGIWRVVILMSLLLPARAWAQEWCVPKQEALAKAKASLTDCLRSGKGCREEFAAVENARAALEGCPETAVRPEAPVTGGEEPTAAPPPIWRTVSTPTPAPVETPKPEVIVAPAHREAYAEGGRAGVGISWSTAGPVFLDGFSPAAQATGAPATILFPLLTAEGVRIEPELAMVLIRASEYDAVDEVLYTTSGNVFSAGFAFEGVWRGDTSLVYAGPKMALSRTRLRYEAVVDGDVADAVEVTRIDFSGGVAIGGEQFLSRNFSLGGEASLIADYIGRPQFRSAADPDRTDGMQVVTRAAIVLRWYP